MSAGKFIVSGLEAAVESLGKKALPKNAADLPVGVAAPQATKRVKLGTLEKHLSRNQVPQAEIDASGIIPHAQKLVDASHEQALNSAKSAVIKDDPNAMKLFMQEMKGSEIGGTPVPPVDMHEALDNTTRIYPPKKVVKDNRVRMVELQKIAKNAKDIITRVEQPDSQYAYVVPNDVEYDTLFTAIRQSADEMGMSSEEILSPELFRQIEKANPSIDFSTKAMEKELDYILNDPDMVGEISIPEAVEILAESIIGAKNTWTPNGYKENLYSSDAIHATNPNLSADDGHWDPGVLFHTRTDAPRGNRVHRVLEIQSDVNNAASAAASELKRAASQVGTVTLEMNSAGNILLALKSNGTVAEALTAGAHFATLKKRASANGNVTDDEVNAAIQYANKAVEKDKYLSAGTYSFNVEADATLQRAKGVAAASQHLPFNVVKTAIGREMAEAKATGKSEVWITIDPKDATKALSRSEGVQKNYETVVKAQALKFAKRVGAKATYDNGYVKIAIPMSLAVPAFADDALSEDDQILKDLGYETDGSNDFAADDDDILGQLGYDVPQPGVVDHADGTKARVTRTAQEHVGVAEQMKRDGYDNVAIQQTLSVSADLNNIDVNAIPDVTDVKIPYVNQVVSDVPMAPGQTEVEYTGGTPVSKRLIAEYAKEVGIDPTNPEGLKAIYEKMNTQIKKARDKTVVQSLMEMKNIPHPLNWMKRQYGDAGAVLAHAEFEAENASWVIAEAKKRGVDVQYDLDIGLYYTTDAEGNQVPFTPGFMESMNLTKYEIMGGVMGGIVGHIKAANAATNALNGAPAGRLVKAGIWGAGIAAGTAGAIIGNQVDQLEQRMNTQMEFDANVALEKGIGVAKMDVLFSVLGDGVIRSAIATGKGSKWIAQRTAYAVKTLFTGNKDGAYKALKELTGDITDDQVDEIIEGWEHLNAITLPGSRRDKAFAILPTTQAGGERIVRGAANVYPKVATAVHNELVARTADLRTLIKANAAEFHNPEEEVNMVVKAVNNHRKTLKKELLGLQQIGSDFADEEMALTLNLTPFIKPIKKMLDFVEDPEVYTLLQGVVENKEALTVVENFDDLFRLRRTIQKLRKTKKGDNASNALDKLTAGIDAGLRRATEDNPGGDIWFENFKSTASAMDEFAELQTNALFRAMKGAKTNKQFANVITQAMPQTDVRYSRATGTTDTTYNEFIKLVPPSALPDVEGAVLDVILSRGKNTLGKEGETQIVALPTLAADLAPYNFKTADANRIKAVVMSMARVWHNDPKLASAAGSYQTGSQQSGIAQTVGGKLHQMLINTIFRSVLKYKPGQAANYIALEEQVGKFLKEPLNTKVATDLLNRIGDDAAAKAAIQQVQAREALERSRIQESIQ